MKVSVKFEGFTEAQAKTAQDAINEQLDKLFPEPSKGLEGGEQSDGYWQSQLKAGSISADEIQGCLTGYAIDPLESAIESTARMMRDELEASGATPDQFPVGAYARLDVHLDELLRMQIDRLSK